MQNQWCVGGGSHKPLVNFYLIIQAVRYQLRKYQIMQAIHQYQNISTSLRLPNAKVKTKKKV
jgi:hypothetical protein